MISEITNLLVRIILGQKFGSFEMPEKIDPNKKLEIMVVELLV